MSRFSILSFALLLTATISASAQRIPDAPNPPRLVCDYTGALRGQEVELEHVLVQFYNQTSNQISVVLVSSFDGTTKEDFAVRLAEKWGIGHKGRNNGILILVKPKTQTERGEAFIATGYGLEGAVPDVVCSRIVNNEMIPRFKQNDYLGGVAAACSIIMQLTQGEFTAEGYLDRTDSGSSPFVFLALFAAIALLFIVSASKGKSDMRNSNIGSHSLTNMALMSMFLNGLSSGHRRGGGWDNFSSGGGSFGGFGGGSFGGGGSGGSW